LLGNRSLAARRGVSSINGSVPHKLVETSDRLRLSVELIGTFPSFGWIDANSP
jgi:hypothetical protein